MPRPKRHREPVTVWLAPQTAQTLRVQAAEQKTTMGDLVDAAVRLYLQAPAPKP